MSEVRCKSGAVPPTVTGSFLPEARALNLRITGLSAGKEGHHVFFGNMRVFPCPRRARDFLLTLLTKVIEKV
jgi:hypothetical protein